ncbi:MAG: divergent polysaccharide deacetylase family protein [Candidatus Hydrogenedentes bacterium]|nr:divergent polysaccharide deacetylase family protein [Candidatus Hydrogenedentota bacterium]
MSAQEDAIKSPSQVPSSERLGAPASWTSITLCAIIVVLAALLCSMLFVRFLDERVQDLRPKSRDLKYHVVGILQDYGVASDYIDSVVEGSRQDEGAVWTTHRIDARLDDAEGVPPVVEAIRSDMANRQVAVYDTVSSATDSAELRLAYRGRNLLYVTLHGGEERLDLVDASRAITQTVLDALKRVGPPSLEIEQKPAVARASTEAQWESVAITARVPDRVPASSVLNEVREAALRSNVDVSSTVLDGRKGTLVRVTYDGLECVQILLAQNESEVAGALSSKLPLLGFQFAGLELENALAVDLPDPEELPLDSEDLNGDAQDQAFPEPQPREWEVPQVAIIVDDGGYGGWITERILAMDNNLTLSILPYATYSTVTATRAYELGFEVMLHMPMENSIGRLTFPGQITTDMTPAEIKELTLNALEEVPYAIGLNNHTGSKFTSDCDAMRVFLEGIQDLPLFFVDSRTIKTSCAYAMAQELNIPCAARDLFLDHDPNPKRIKERFLQLMDIAKRHGRGIGICHFRKNTVPVMEAMLPEMEKAGIELVPISEFIE